MKKIVLFAMVLLLCFPAVSQAVDESQYIGTWMLEAYDEETGRYSIDILRLTADHQAYYLVQSFHPGEVGFSRLSAKTWSVKGNGIHIILGENANTDAFILDDGRLGFKLVAGGYTPYTKISDGAKTEEAQTLDMLKTGVKIPQGEYFIGSDIPAGRYIAYAGNARKITLWVYDARGWSNYYYLGSYNNEPTMVLTLEEGGKLRVVDASVTIKEFSGLFQ